MMRAKYDEGKSRLRSLSKRELQGSESPIGDY